MFEHITWFMITVIVTVLPMESSAERHAIVRTVKIASNLKTRELLQ